jgi:hypothetical protein
VEAHHLVVEQLSLGAGEQAAFAQTFHRFSLPRKEHISQSPVMLRR